MVSDSGYSKSLGRMKLGSVGRGEQQVPGSKKAFLLLAAVKEEVPSTIPSTYAFFKVLR